MLLSLLIFGCFSVFGLNELTMVRPKGEKISISCLGCGEKRNFQIYPATSDDASPDPRDLIIVIHGFGSNAARSIAATRGRYQDLAHTSNLVVVHAQSEQKSKNWFIEDIGSVPNPGDIDASKYVDDPAYFSALWAEVISRHPSVERVHLIGLSRGAMASYALTCAKRLPIASLTVITMPMPEIALTDCLDVEGVDFSLVNGTRDTLVPFYGGLISLPWLAFAGERKFGLVTRDRRDVGAVARL